MDEKKVIAGFSKRSKEDKIRWLVQAFSQDPLSTEQALKQFWHPNPDLQKVFDGFSENTLSNYFMPFGIAPNFLINDRVYAVPMVIEESSVVAAAASAAKFWMKRGGFKATVLSTQKIGQVHFLWRGNPQTLKAHLEPLKAALLEEAGPLTANMEKRGGGVLGIELVDMTELEPDYYQLKVRFETCDSMGANFINSVLESFADSLVEYVERQEAFPEIEKKVDIIMSILSNYTPECLVRAEVSCPIQDLPFECEEKIDPAEFANKFFKAVRIAHLDPHRAATHNKGIYNGVDAVVLATGNDFRAVEACGHTFAARDGQYRSLSYCSLDDGIFRFWLDLPIALGTVGGLTRLHPLAHQSLEILGNPGAQELMMVIASVGLAQNFAALRSLVTTGIQHGHMKMHLRNILNHLGATDAEVQEAERFFLDRAVSFAAVRDFLQSLPPAGTERVVPRPKSQP